jgi:leucyl/phenylalanyl-tRNA---protein transferase
MKKFTPQTILQAYAQGIFPMAESAEARDIFWVEPHLRGVIPLEGLILSTSLKKAVRATRYQVRLNHDFEAVIAACAAPRFGQKETWINSSIRVAYSELFTAGYCHTLEIYEEEQLVGGLYGLALGGAFFGESMFHLVPNASKIALVHLVARLKQAGFSLLDTQFITTHLQSLGAVEMPQSDYKKLLAKALPLTPLALQANMDGQGALAVLERS